MTKRLSLVCVSLTLAAVCAYFLTGKIIQKNYYEAIAKLNNQPNVRIDLLSYKRGLFTSIVSATVELGSDNLADAQIIPMQQVITHGPVILARTLNGPSIKFLAGQVATSLGQPWDARLEEATQSKNPLSIVTLVKFNNRAQTWLRFTGVDQTTPSNFHVAWDTVTGEIDHDLSFSDYRGSINLPSIIMKKPEWQLALNNLNVNLDANIVDANYSSSNTLTTKNLVFTKNTQEVIKLDAITAKLAFFTKNNNLALDLEARVANSKILDKEFQNDSIRLTADNLNRATLAHLPRLNSMNPKATIDLLQQLTLASTDVSFELPKHFTESLLSYLSFEIYRASYLGQLDKRAAPAVLQDITGSINKLVQGAVKQELFLDTGSHYALNFNRSPQG